MLKLLNFMGLAIGLVLVAIAFGGVKRIHHCTWTAVLGGAPTCDNNIQWFDQ
jgi:hypothetical protein